MQGYLSPRLKKRSHREAGHPGSVKGIGLGRKVVPPVDRAICDREGLKDGHAVVVTEPGPVAACLVHIPLPEAGGHSWVEAGLGCWWLQSLDGSVAQLDFCLVPGAAQKSLHQFSEASIACCFNGSRPIRQGFGHILLVLQYRCHFAAAPWGVSRLLNHQGMRPIKLPLKIDALLFLQALHGLFLRKPIKHQWQCSNNESGAPFC